MTATKKLFLAAIVLGAGFGVARLTGRPDVPWRVSHRGTSPVITARQAKTEPRTGDVSAPVSAANGARLVPDPSSDNPYRAEADEGIQAPAQRSQNMPNEGGADVSRPLVFGNDQPPRNFAPRAQLRDEAPRPLDFESRDEATVYTAPLSVQHAEAMHTLDARTAAVDGLASGLLPANFAPVGPSGATLHASYSQPVDRATIPAAAAPPPWPERPAGAGPRTHVVVDGDSLERLAGRYLDDSSRAHEIYEANRELLSDPDLLPIGVELFIPASKDRAAFDDSLPQSSLAKDASLRAATNDGMVRVRPVPSAVNVLPRAQLLPPVRAE